MSERRRLYVFRLIVEKPEGSEEPGWEPEGWRQPWMGEHNRFTWPRRRHWLSSEGASRRARQLREWGAKVRIEMALVENWRPAFDGAAELERIRAERG